MTVLTVRRTAADLATWKMGYDDHGSSRKEHGAISYQVLQSAEHPNGPLDLIEVEQPSDTEGFANNRSLRRAMSARDVIGAPDISFPERSDEVIY